MGRLPIYVYPFAIGFGYLMPLDLSLSLWFFLSVFGGHSASFSARLGGQLLSVYRPNNAAARGSALAHSRSSQVGGRFGRYLAVCSPFGQKMAYTDSRFSG